MRWSTWRRTSGATGITLVVARLRTLMEEQLEAGGVTEVIGDGHFYPTVRAAVDAVERAERDEARQR